MTPRSAREGWVEQNKQRLVGLPYSDKAVIVLREAMAFADAHPMAEGQGVAVTSREAFVEKWFYDGSYPINASKKDMLIDLATVALQDAISNATPPAQGARVLVDAIRKVEEDKFGYRYIDIAVNNANEGDTVRVRVTEEPSSKPTTDSPA